MTERSASLPVTSSTGWAGFKRLRRRGPAVAAELHPRREVAPAALALCQANRRSTVRAELLRRDRLAAVRACRRPSRDISAEHDLLGHLAAHLRELNGGALGLHFGREFRGVVDTQTGLLVPAIV